MARSLYIVFMDKKSHVQYKFQIAIRVLWCLKEGNAFFCQKVINHMHRHKQHKKITAVKKIQQ